MKVPKISIVTPSFNQGHFIEDTIRSVINQNYINKEYLIIDGGSHDNTIDIIKKYGNNIDYWVSEPDKGQADAVNKGFKRATGDIIGWINSDDQYYSHNVLSRISYLFVNNPKVHACYCDNVYIDENNNLLYLRKGLPFYSKGLLQLWNFIHQPTVFLRREVINEFSLDIKLKYVMDYEYWLRISKKYRFKHIALLASASRWHTKCKTISGSNNVFSELREVALSKHHLYAVHLLPFRFIYKFFFGINRLYSIFFISLLKTERRNVDLRMNGLGKFARHQLLGFR